MKNPDAPYSPSFTDHFMRWVQGLPISTWLFYLLVLGVLIVGFNALAWMAGLIPYGEFDLYRSSVPVYPIASLMLMHYLNHIARRSLTTFRPVMDVTEDESIRLQYRLLVLPRMGERVTIVISLILTAIYISATPYLLTLIQTAPLIALLECILYVFAFGWMSIYFYHTLWQLRTVRDIHDTIRHMDLFNRAPLYAFSNLSSRTGISLLAMSYFGIVTDPATFENIALINVTIAASIIAILSFLLPLQGMYRRIVAEKRRLLNTNNERLGTLMSSFNMSPNGQSTDEFVEYHQLLASLSVTRDMIEKIPTLPWETGTLVGFVTVFVLPFFARIVTGLLAGVLLL